MHQHRQERRIFVGGIGISSCAKFGGPNFKNSREIFTKKNNDPHPPRMKSLHQIEQDDNRRLDKPTIKQSKSRASTERREQPNLAAKQTP